MVAESMISGLFGVSQHQLQSNSDKGSTTQELQPRHTAGKALWDKI